MILDEGCKDNGRPRHVITILARDRNIASQHQDSTNNARSLPQTMIRFSIQTIDHDGIDSDVSAGELVGCFFCGVEGWLAVAWWAEYCFLGLSGDISSGSLMVLIFFSWVWLKGILKVDLPLLPDAEPKLIIPFHCYAKRN